MVSARGLALLLVPLLILSSAFAHAAQLHASVDQSALALNEPVTLTLALTDSDTRLRAEGVSPNVDLSVLAKDFDVGTPTVSNRYNVYQGRGRSTSELRVELFPRRAGTLTIPVFRLEGLATQALTLSVRALPADAVPEVFSRGGVSKGAVWQREQFIAWLDVYHRVKLKSASVGEYIDTEPLRIELMEHRELPQSEREETVKGVRYQVPRIAWAIFPKESGELRIHLPDVWLVTADDRKLRLPYLDARVRVRALPANVTADIPVGAPQLSQTPPGPPPGAGQLSSWTVTVQGRFSRFALPDLLPLPPAPAGIKLYADRAERSSDVKADGVTTALHYTLSALPELGGRHVLPAVRLPYFDTERGQVAMAELAAPVFEVSGGAAAPSCAATPPVAPSNTASGAPAPAATRDKGMAASTDDVRAWQIGAAVFASLWLLTLVLWWRTTRLRPLTPQTPLPHATASPHKQHPLLAQLLTALNARSLEAGLHAWESNNGVDQDVRAAVRAVQNRLYGPHKAGDDAALTTQGAAAGVKIRVTEKKRPAGAAVDPWRPESFSRALPPA